MERKLRESQHECQGWKTRCVKAESASVIASRDKDKAKAYAGWDILPESIVLAESMQTEKKRADCAQAKASAERHEKERVISELDELVKKAEVCSLPTSPRRLPSIAFKLDSRLH